MRTATTARSPGRGSEKMLLCPSLYHYIQFDQRSLGDDAPRRTLQYYSKQRCPDVGAGPCLAKAWRKLRKCSIPRLERGAIYTYIKKRRFLSSPSSSLFFLFRSIATHFAPAVCLSRSLPSYETLYILCLSHSFSQVHTMAFRLTTTLAILATASLSAAQSCNETALNSTIYAYPITM